MTLCCSHADQTLTSAGVLSILQHSSLPKKDWLKSDHLADTLLIPAPHKEAILQQLRTPEEQGQAVITYWSRTLYNASWSTLAGALFYLREKQQVIDEVKHQIRSLPRYSMCVSSFNMLNIHSKSRSMKYIYTEWLSMYFVFAVWIRSLWKYTTNIDHFYDLQLAMLIMKATIGIVGLLKRCLNCHS